MAAFSHDAFDESAFDALQAGNAFDAGAFDANAFDALPLDAAFDAQAFDADAFNAVGEASERPSFPARVVATLPPPVVLVRARYVSGAERPVVGKFGVRFQQGKPIEAGVTSHQTGVDRLGAAWAVRFQQGRMLQQGITSRFNDSPKLTRSAAVRFQDGLRLDVDRRFRFQQSPRLDRSAAASYQDGLRLDRGATFRFQDGSRVWRDGLARFQSGIALHVGVSNREGSGLRLVAGRSTRYQQAILPPPGRHAAVVPPEPTPCYVPSPHLVFDAEWVGTTNLLFVCDKDDGPGPEPGETVVVPVRRIYTVINSATLRRVDGDVLIPTFAMTLTIDVDSWTWGFTARTPGTALPDLEPGASGEPVEVEAKINGVAYRALVEGISRERVFGRSDLNVTGRGKAAVLDAPYTPLSTFGNPSNARTAQQLAEDVLTLNGVSIGWAVNWAPEDWLVPAGVFSHQGTYMTALNAIASAAGAYIQPHRTAKSLDFLLRYPAKPWEWGDVTPDFELPADVVQKEGIVWTDKAAYNRVFVRGVKVPYLGQVTRAGTAGDIDAPMVTDPLITTTVAGRQRGLPALADVGRQAAVSLRLPVLAETGIIPPGKFVRYVDGGVTRIGLVRSTSAAVERADEKLTIWQTIGVETHVSI